MPETKEVIDFERIGKKGFPRHYAAFSANPPMKTVPVVDDHPQTVHDHDDEGIAALDKGASERDH